MGEHEADEIHVAPPVVFITQGFTNFLNAFNVAELIF